jgi:hypothetical protein
MGCYDHETFIRQRAVPSEPDFRPRRAPDLGRRRIEDNAPGYPACAQSARTSGLMGLAAWAAVAEGEEWAIKDSNLGPAD